MLSPGERLVVPRLNRHEPDGCCCCCSAGQSLTTVFRPGINTLVLQAEKPGLHLRKCFLTESKDINPELSDLLAMATLLTTIILLIWIVLLKCYDIWESIRKPFRECSPKFPRTGYHHSERYLSRPLGIEENIGLSVAHFLHTANLHLRVITVDPET